MATFLHQRNWEREKLRKGFLCGPSWVLSAVFCFMLSTKCVLSRSDVNYVFTYPDGDIYVRYPGHPLEIYCTTLNYTSKDLVFMMNNTELHSEVINETTIKYYDRQPQIHREMYFCTNKAANKHAINTVLVDTPPENVTDFKCISNDLKDLNCSWSIPRTCSDNKYELSFYSHGTLLSPCSPTRDEYTWHCTWNHNTVPSYRQQLPTYKFKLEATNYFGKNIQYITINHFAVVKPEKPANLIVTKTYPHRAHIQWQVSQEIYDFLDCGIEHRIEYQIAKIDKPNFFRQVNVSSMPQRTDKSKTFKFELMDLPYSHMRYDVRVFMKTKVASDEFWSEFSSVKFTTASEIPPRPPAMAAGAFTVSTYGEKQMIYIYWMQLEIYEENGENFTYRAFVTQDNSTTEHWPEKDKMSFINLTDASISALHVAVQSENAIGPSKERSFVYIPSSADILPQSDITSFTKLAYENGTYELSWDTNYSDMDNYTLFWCQFNWTQVCVGRLNFTTISADKRKYIIHLPKDIKYQFAIAVNKGIQTSGMIWAHCDISKDVEAMYSSTAQLGHEPADKRFVVLNWKMNCKLSNDIILGYNISYCPIVSMNNSQCDKTIGHHSVHVSNPMSSSVNVTGLLPCTIYKFDLTLITKYGPKLIKGAGIEVTTMEDTPSDPQNISVTNIKNDSMVISWDPPLHKNGNIKEYRLLNYDKFFAKDPLLQPNLTDTNRRNYTLKNLQSFTNYSWKVQACNSRCSLSEFVKPVIVRTAIGPPEQIPQPRVSLNVLKWDTSSRSTGYITKYQVRRIKDKEEPEIFNTSINEFKVNLCDTARVSESWSVRAINIDDHEHHGAYSDDNNVFLPPKSKDENGNWLTEELLAQWSPENTVVCQTKPLIEFVVSIFMLIFLFGMVYAAIKLYKLNITRKDIKPEFPPGIVGDIIIEKRKPAYSRPIKPPRKDTKPDERLLLSDTEISGRAEIKREYDNNCGASDQSDSTALSDLTREGPMERESTSSDAGSESSLHSDTTRGDDKSDNSNADDGSGSFRELTQPPTFIYKQPNIPTSIYDEQKAPVASRGYVTTEDLQHVSKPSPYIQTSEMEAMEKYLSQPPPTSYVLAGLPTPMYDPQSIPPASNRPGASKGYVTAEEIENVSKIQPPAQNTQTETKPVVAKDLTQPTTSSYVLAGLSTPLRQATPAPSRPEVSNGYVTAEHAQAKLSLNLPQLGSSPTKGFEPESLPSMSVLSGSADKPSCNSNYIQLLSLDNVRKPGVMPPANSEYIPGSGDGVTNKHLRRMSGGQEPIIVDQSMMSPDAYCKFSHGWIDPATDTSNSIVINTVPDSNEN